MSASGILGWIKWPLCVLGILFFAFIAWRSTVVFDMGKTNEAVAAIHAQKITLADVQGTNLPPVPDQAENDSTVVGIDKNNNGIRDDVELAIFKKYPTSAKTRAAELQYAMTEQMYLTRVTNTETWKAVAEESDRGYRCIFEVFRRNVTVAEIKVTLEHSKEVESLLFNTKARQDQKDNAYNLTTSYGSLQQESCDVELATLPN